MKDGGNAKSRIKRRLHDEAIRTALVFAYLALILSGYTMYRRIILAEHGIDYFHYGYGLVEAAVLTKVVMLGEALRLGRRYSNSPLILPTLHKTVSFSILVLAFTALERVVGGLLRGKDLGGALDTLDAGKTEILVKVVVMFVAFIPLFAMWEIGRVIGEDKLFALFFKRRPAEDSSRE